MDERAAKVRFHSPGGQTKVRAELDTLLRSADNSIRAAVCYFTRPGERLLSKHVVRLNLPSSFYVAGIDPPTNLNALARLHALAPGHVYIHLGGVTPEERNVQRSLMHSKVLLSRGKDGFRLWVGSHNLTGMAIQGGNFEAALSYFDTTESSVICDAISHLEVCRATAEVFDPNSMQRYIEIQKERGKNRDWDVENDVLVIHAEASPLSMGSSFIVRVQLRPTELDRRARPDGRVRLFLHPTGSLHLKQAVDYRKATMWTGEITAVVRTEDHPRNRGAGGQFAGAHYDIDIPDLAVVPKLIPGGTSRVRPRTQIVVRADKPGVVGAELFSIDDKSPIQSQLSSVNSFELHSVDLDMKQFFTKKSVKDSSFVYRPATGIRQVLRVRGYGETMRSALPENFDALGEEQEEEAEDSGGDVVAYSMAEPKYQIDPFFFMSKHVVRRKPRENPGPLDE